MTPLQQQYLPIKKQFPSTIVLFHLGDFNETFNEDAKAVASVCNIMLTGREMGTGSRLPFARRPQLFHDSHFVARMDELGKVVVNSVVGDA